MKGRMQAMMVASSLALVSLLFPPVSIVSSASVALVTLRHGAKEGLYVLAFSCLSAALLGSLLFGNVQFAMVYGLVLWLPIWLISIVLREGKHLSVAIQMSVLLAMLGVVIFYLYADQPTAIWESVLTVMIQPMLANAPADVSVDQVKQSIQMAARFMTGAIAAGTVYGLLFGLFLARWWQAKLYNPGGFRAEYLSLRTQSIMALVAVIVAAVGALSSGIVSEVFWNLTILFAVLYTFIGASVLHCAFAGMKTGRFMVPFLYITIVLVPHIIALIVVVGICDAWLDLRRNFLNKEKV